MKTLQRVCEGILGNIDAGIENVVEMLDRMKKDLAWVRRLKETDAVYYDAALFNVTRNILWSAQTLSNDEKEALGAFMVASRQEWMCDTWNDGIDNWEERTYFKNQYIKYSDSEYANGILNAAPDDYRWNGRSSNSFYNYFWDPDYVHSLDQEELLVSKECQQYSKKLIAVAKKYGLKLNPIF